MDVTPEIVVAQFVHQAVIPLWALLLVIVPLIGLYFLLLMAPPSPVFNSSGFITYRVQANGRTTIFLQRNTGRPIPLIAGKDDAEILDFTAQNGGLFAIWAKEGDAANVYIVRPDGSLVNPVSINQGWALVKNGDWSIDGQRLVIEAVTDGKPAYYYFDAAGKLIGQPVFP